jgi:hypothetical protein
MAQTKPLSLTKLREKVAALLEAAAADLGIESPVRAAQSTYSVREHLEADKVFCAVAIAESPGTRLARRSDIPQRLVTRLDVTVLARLSKRDDPAQQDLVLTAATLVQAFLAANPVTGLVDTASPTPNAIEPLLPENVDLVLAVSVNDLELYGLMVCQVQAFYSHL